MGIKTEKMMRGGKVKDVRVLEVKQSVFANNDKQAEELRDRKSVV